MAVIYLDIACNDPDNGVFAGRAPMLQIGAAEFQARDWARGPAFTEIDGGIRLAGKRWSVENSKDWVGNWCWNRYLLGMKGRTHRWYLTDFVIWLRGRSLFSLDTAPSEFFDWYNSDNDIAPAHVHKLVCDLEE
jgi:hypothetical protein